MAKKKAAPKESASPAAAPAMNVGANPMMGMMNNMGPMNPMMQMAQMMQMMMSGGAASGMMDPSAIPFSMGQPVDDGDAGLNEDFVRPALFQNLIKHQEAVPLDASSTNCVFQKTARPCLAESPKAAQLPSRGLLEKARLAARWRDWLELRNRGRRLPLSLLKKAFTMPTAMVETTCVPLHQDRHVRNGSQ